MLTLFTSRRPKAISAYYAYGSAIMDPPRTLKQRLAMLTAHTNAADHLESARSAEITRPYIPRVNIPKRRPFNPRPVPPPIPPKRIAGYGDVASHREDKVQEVMTRFIFQAGVDYESVSQPMLCPFVIIHEGCCAGHGLCTL